MNPPEKNGPTLIGYARVSTTDQSLDLQVEQLEAAGCARVFKEKRSGTTTEGRTELELCLGYVREGDILLVTRLDRLARSVADLGSIVKGLTAKGVGIRALQQGDFDTTSSMGKVVIGILGVFAEFETDLRRERQREGIEKAKAKGVYSRPKARKVDPAEVRRLRVEEGLGATAIAKRLGSSRQTVWRAAPGIWGETPAALKRAG